MANLTDAQLLKRAAREPEFFGLFYRRYVRDIYGRLRRETGSESVASDLTAETFAQAFLHHKRFRDPGTGSAGAWLHGIASNLLGTYRRREQLDQRALRKLGMPVTLEIDPAIAKVEERDEDDRRSAQLLAQLASLPASQQEAIRLRVFDGLSYPQIADYVGVEPELVRARVSRGLRALRSTFGRGAAP